MTQAELFNNAVSVATSNGYSFYEKCNCGGWFQHHYKKGNRLLKIGVKASRFQLHADNKRGPVLARGNYDQIQQAINEHP